MSLPVGPTPVVAPRAAAWRAGLDAAIVPAAGIDAIMAELHRPGALVVTTGQQPGLFTGPIYTVHKALAAAALARRLARQWNRPVVPLFWVAGDDHDYAEASVAAWTDATGAVVEWKLPERASTAPQRSVAREVLPADVIAGLDLLASSLPDGMPRDTTMRWLRKHYVAGATLHTAYCGALAELLAPFGVACFDATHPAVKHAQIPLITAALDRAGELDGILAALPDPHTGISAGEGATLVFLETPDGRDRLILDGAGVRTRRSGAKYSLAEIKDLLARTPEDFSANVLLRPVVESALLPTVAYVAGPAEFRYQSRQAAALYGPLGVTPQQPVPRWSGAVVEPWADRLLGKLGVSVEDVLADNGTLARTILRRDLPASAVTALAQLREAIAGAAATLAAAGTALDPVLERAVDGRRRRLVGVSDDLERLFERHLRKRDDIAYAQFARLVRALKPNGRPQERVLTAAAFLGRYGAAWSDAVVRAADLWANE